MLQPYKLRFTGHGLFRDLTGKNTIPQWHVSGEKWRAYVSIYAHAKPILIEI